MKTFPLGGIHPSDNKKWSSTKSIEVMELPDIVNIPLGQHIGAPAAAIVKKGDKVVTGQLIAMATGFVSANIHSPISGTVTAIDMIPNGQGLRQMMVTIKREGDEWLPEIDRSTEIKRECLLDGAAIMERIKQAGIVGMGGASFPSHVKLSIPNGCKAEYLIVNGVECEPYLTSDYRVMLERGEELLIGVEIVKKMLNVDKAIIGIENNKPDAIAYLKSLKKAKGFAVKIEPLKVQYPQGGEKQLIAAVIGRQVPPPPALPIHVGAVVINASTVVAIYEAVQKNKPLIERVVTVTGKNLHNPCNLLARVGTPISKLIEKAGGLPEGDVKVVNGGPMMGRAMVNVDAPVVKACSGITIFNAEEVYRVEADTCIKCAKCVAACPMGLEPYLLSKLSRKQLWDRAENDRITDCIECGSCQYTCPAGLPLVDFIRLGKQKVLGIVRARNASQK